MGSMGFSGQAASQALRSTGNDVRAAMNQLLSNGGSGGGGGGRDLEQKGAGPLAQQAAQQKMLVTVPAGHTAGMSFLVDIPGKPRMRVTVPEGCGPGSQLSLMV